MLLTVLTLGTNVWVGRYTTWTVPRFLTLFGGGGLLSWVLTELVRITVSAYQPRALPVTISVLTDRRCMPVLGTALAVGLVSVTFLGSIEVTSAGDDEARLVTASHLAPRAIVPGGQVRFVVATTPWTSRDVDVKVSGYPAQTVSVRSFEVAALSVPLDFVRQPVILLRPTRALHQVLANHPLILHVRVKRAGEPVMERLLKPFRGQAVWIGCDADVKLRGADREDLARDFPDHPDMLQPAGLQGGPLDLRPGDWVEVRVLNSDAPSVENDTVYTRTHFNVREPRDGGGIPTQVERLLVDETSDDDAPEDTPSAP